jgi:Xaa-Pro aminopeptidase
MGPDFASRLKGLRKLVSEGGLDAALISSPRDISYYTGSMLSGDASFLLIDPRSRPMLMISCLSNYVHETSTMRVRFFRGFKDIIKELGSYGLVGFDERNTSADFFMKLKGAGVKMKPFGPAIKKPRMIKDAWEIRQIRRAVKATEDIFRDASLAGSAETGVSDWVRRRIADLGLRNAFSPIVASGRNSAFIHYSPGKRRIRETDMVIMDIGVRFNGYCSDLTRTFCHRPDRKQRKVHEDVLNIQEQVIDNVRPGIRFDTLEKFSRGLYEKMGYKSMHAIGHGVGLSIHEGPSSEDTLQDGMVFTVEPGVYIKKWGGCRIEDMVFIGNSKTRPLSKFPRDLT